MSGGTLTLAVFDEASGWALPERLATRLSERAGDAWNVRAVGTRARLLEAMGDTVGLVGMPLTEVQVEQHVGRLRWVQLSRSSGDANASIGAAMEGGVRVSSAASVRAPYVAEHAMALALTQLRGVDLSIARQREHRWASREVASDVRSLNGATVSVIGAPPLVREVARRAKAFGATVIGCATGVAGVERVIDEHVDAAHSVSGLHDAINGADVVIVGAPRLPSTVGLVGRKALNAMKHNGVLVDVSKGGVVDHGALIDALRKGRLSGAALDVFATEPLPATSPFWTMPNVVVTPHVSAAGDGFWERLIDQAGENARRAVTGEPLIDELPPTLYDAA